MRYLKLTEIEQSELENLYKSSSDIMIRERCQCLLLSNKGIKTTELMSIFSVTRITIYNWFNLWETHQIQGLYRKEGQGRNRILSVIGKDSLEKIVEKHPQNLALVLAEIQDTYAVQCHKETLKRQLKNMGMDIQASTKITER
jgi:transposase